MYESLRDQLVGRQSYIELAAFVIESTKTMIFRRDNETMKHDLKIIDIKDLADAMSGLMGEFNEINVAMSTNFDPKRCREADLEKGRTTTTTSF